MMRTITTKEAGFWDYSVEGPFEVQTLRQRIVTYQVPHSYDLILRYLRTFYPKLAKYVNEYRIEPQGWGWYLRVDGDTVTLSDRLTTKHAGDANPSLTVNFKTRKQKKTAIRMIVALLSAMHE